MSTRLDRSREERAVLEPASVAGQAFAHSMVEELAPEPVAPRVELHLRRWQASDSSSRSPPPATRNAPRGSITS